MTLFLGQSYRQICINMHTRRGIGILVIFATIGEKENFLSIANEFMKQSLTSFMKIMPIGNPRTIHASLIAI